MKSNFGLSKYQINCFYTSSITAEKFYLAKTLSPRSLETFQVRETRRVELLAGGASSATLLLMFDRMLWEKKSKSKNHYATF